jgi:hypothetical protein
MYRRGSTYVARELSERDADRIVAELQHLERAGHEIADVRHDGRVWRVFAFERRFRSQERLGLIAFRRRASD